MPDTAAAAPPAVETIDLTKQYGSLAAVDKVSLTLRPGEIFGLIGPNGAGKSTLIKMLTTLTPPSSGTAKISGFDVQTQSAQVRRRIGYVPQQLSADRALTGYERLLLSARLYNIPRAEREERIQHALTVMGLTEAAGRQAGNYSGGMIRRLEIAQSMLHLPAMLFLDEPTVGLDPVARRSVWDHVRKLRAEIRTTMLITTHYMEEADELCDRIAVIHRGRIQRIGTAAELKALVGPGATLDDVFAHLTGAGMQEQEGSYSDIRRTRESASKNA